MRKQTIFSDKAPGAIGPYSHGVRYGELVFTSGQLGIDAVTGSMAYGLAAQTHMCFKNLIAVLEAGGSCLANCIKITVYLKNINDFAEVNEIYQKYFTENFPARTCIEAANLPKYALVEIEAVAHC